MKRTLCLALLLVSGCSMASSPVSSEGMTRSYVADVMPGMNGQPTMLIPSTYWVGIRVDRNDDGTCTETRQGVLGFSLERKLGVDTSKPLLEAQVHTVDCPSANDSAKR
jgi:hypothetical protein